MDAFWELTPYEVNSIIQSRYKRDRHETELMYHSVSVAINNVMNKKKIKLFDDKKPNEGQPQKISKDKKTTEWEALMSTFQK